MTSGSVTNWRPVQQLKCIDAASGHWRATGDDPFFIAFNPISFGWSRIGFEFTTETGKTHQSFLYIDDGNDFEPESRARPAVSNGAVDTIFCAPTNLVSLRLDPMEEACEFHLGTVAIEAMSADAIPRLDDATIAVRRVAFESSRLQLRAADPAAHLRARSDPTRF